MWHFVLFTDWHRRACCFSAPPHLFLPFLPLTPFPFRPCSGACVSVFLLHSGDFDRDGSDRPCPSALTTGALRLRPLCLCFCLRRVHQDGWDVSGEGGRPARPSRFEVWACWWLASGRRQRPGDILAQTRAVGVVGVVGGCCDCLWT